MKLQEALDSVRFLNSLPARTRIYGPLSHRCVSRQNELLCGWSVTVRLPRHQHSTACCRHRALHAGVQTGGAT